MKHGFIRVAAATPKIKVANPEYNATQIILELEKLVADEVKIIVFPELCITAYPWDD